MLGLSWTELLVIGVVALIVIGPKDLPIMMRRIGEFMGQVRRMGSEFQRELQRAAAIDELKDIKKSVTEPIRQANADITSQFNKITSTGVRPTGALAPTDPKSESVVSAIEAQAGMAPSAVPTAAKEPSAAPPKASPAGDGAITNPAFALSPPPKTAPAAPKPDAVAAPAEVTAAETPSPKPKRVRKPRAKADDAVSVADLPPPGETAAPAIAKPPRARRTKAASSATPETPADTPKPKRASRARKAV